jgi:hypothetical protein
MLHQGGGGRHKMGKIMGVLLVCCIGFGLLSVGNLILSIPSVPTSAVVMLTVYSVGLRAIEVELIACFVVVTFQAKDFDHVILTWTSLTDNMSFKYVR